MEVSESSLGRAPRPIRSAAKHASPEGCRLAYRTQSGLHSQIVLDGKVSPEFDDILLGPTFSPSARRIAYVAVSRNTPFIVLDGDTTRSKRVHGEGEHVVLSPDLLVTAYPALRGDHWAVVHDGQYGPSFDGVLSQSLRFSPRDDRLAYAASRGDAKFLVLTGARTSEAYDGIAPETVCFSPDGEHFAYCAARRGKWLTILR